LHFDVDRARFGVHGAFGFKLLKSMGWKEGEGLGKEGAGRVEPVSHLQGNSCAIQVRTEQKNNRTGLGHDKEPPKTQKQKILDKTRERFNRIQDK